MGQPRPPSPPTRREPVPGWEALGDRLREPERPDIKPRNVVDVSPRHDLDEGCVNASQRAEDASDSRKTATSCPPTSIAFSGA